VKPTVLLVTGPPGTGKSTLAEHASGLLQAPVLGWDWVMAALTPFDEVQRALGSIDSEDYRRVGWSLLWNVTLAQIRNGRSVILDGVARDVEVAATRSVVERHATFFIVATSCGDREAHQKRIEGRQRHIPGWYELDWKHVEARLNEWEPLRDADLYIDTALSFDENRARITQLLQGVQ
jgi:predicted kinase